MRVALGDVPETMLWTLYHRAKEAARPDGVIDDPLAVELTERIEYPFAERFGEGGPLAQWQALRATTFDRAVKSFLARHPDGTVVGLWTWGWDRKEAARIRATPGVAELRRLRLPSGRGLQGNVLAVLGGAFLAVRLARFG